MDAVDGVVGDALEHVSQVGLRVEVVELGLANQVVRWLGKSRAGHRHSTLGYCSPAQFLEDWLVKQAAQHEKAA